MGASKNPRWKKNVLKECIVCSEYHSHEFNDEYQLCKPCHSKLEDDLPQKNKGCGIGTKLYPYRKDVSTTNKELGVEVYKKDYVCFSPDKCEYKDKINGANYCSINDKGYEMSRKEEWFVIKLMRALTFG